jgi:hypothetical protein
MAHLIPVKIDDGAPRNGIGQLISITATYEQGAELGQMFNKSWKKYLVRRLSRVAGGMDGLTFTGKGYTNQPEAAPEVQP